MRTLQRIFVLILDPKFRTNIFIALNSRAIGKESEILFVQINFYPPIWNWLKIQFMYFLFEVCKAFCLIMASTAQTPPNVPINTNNSCHY